MKKKIRDSLFIKIFAVTCLLMVVCCSATYGFIAWLVPQTYSTDLDAALDKEVNALISELECTVGADSGFLFDEFLLNNTVLFQLYDENGREIALPSQYNHDFPDAARNDIVFEGEPSLYGAVHSYLFRFQDSEIVYTLSVAGDAEPVNQLTDTIGSIVPPLTVMAVFLSVIGAVLYSRYVTKPVIEISRVSEKMSG
ncbi:MAG: hypothetical protein K2I96_04465, partial [Lachnospiraceae bacterium]|nr:hypothetical protein [Lachnospiraceae bacterium]